LPNAWEDEAAEAPERGGTGGGGGGEQEDGEAANGALCRLPPRPPSGSWRRRRRRSASEVQEISNFGWVEKFRSRRTRFEPLGWSGVTQVQEEGRNDGAAEGAAQWELPLARSTPF